MSMVVVDAGKSAVRCRVHPERVDATAPGMRPELAGSVGSGDLLAARVLEVWQATGRDGADVRLAVVGTTFLPGREELASCLQALCTLWPRADIQVMDDGVLAHAAALGRHGMVASVGTGVIVVGVDRQGVVHRSDGWGPDLGDRGGAVGLGVAGLRAACAAADGAGQPTTLLDFARTHLGGTLDIRAASRMLADPDRVRRLGAFAIDVCRAAAAADPTAQALVARAADEVASTCASMARTIDDSTVVLVGRLLLDPTYRAAVSTTLSDLELRECAPRAQPLDVPADIITASAYQRTSAAVRFVHNQASMSDSVVDRG